MILFLLNGDAINSRWILNSFILKVRLLNLMEIWKTKNSNSIFGQNKFLLYFLHTRININRSCQPYLVFKIAKRVQLRKYFVDTFKRASSYCGKIFQKLNG